MDADAILALLNSTFNSSSASASTPPSSSPLLDLIFPGFSTITQLAHRVLGIDITLFIPVIIAVAACTFAWNYASAYVQDLVTDYFMSVVDVRSTDPVYAPLMTWISEQGFAKQSRHFILKSNFKDYYYDSEDEEEDKENDVNKQRLLLSYAPACGSHNFWYRGRLLHFKREETKNDNGYYGNEEISLSCYGRSPWILKELLVEARMAQLARDEQKTVIFRAATQLGGTDPHWARSAARVPRPMSTIILDEKMKSKLVQDVSDYMAPDTRRWYLNRGIPYRRGYLLHGPPGTGKSSLSVALAGHFKLKIYIVSLSSAAASEENLNELFNDLPRKCVVLLEDIDAAGLTHARSKSDEEETQEESEATPPTPPMSPDGDASSPVIGPSLPKGGNPKLSLSGLLNILDGVASQEGRLLIMTTNHIEALDPALIRPGRIDMTLHFGRADKTICAAMFRAIFAPIEGDLPNGYVETDEEVKARESLLSNIDDMAKRFAEMVPSEVFSPAELQGFMLQHKMRPHDAIDSIAAWVKEEQQLKLDRSLGLVKSG